MNKFVGAVCVVAVVSIYGSPAIVSGATDTTTSTTIPDSSSTSSSAVVPVSTAAETSVLYPTRALRFPPYSRLNPPLLPENSGSGRRVVYKNSLQWVWIVDVNNTIVRVFPVSGLRGVPNPGKYDVTSQSLRSFSLDFKGVWFNHMTRFALGPHGGNIGFHAIPTKNGKSLQTEAQLGSFQGSGCIRVRPDDAKFIFQYAKLGTTVVVLP